MRTQNSEVRSQKARLADLFRGKRGKQINVLHPDRLRNSALCTVGIHDWVTFKRPKIKVLVTHPKSEWHTMQKWVPDGPRMRVCRACGVKRFQATTGQWLTVK